MFEPSAHARIMSTGLYDYYVALQDAGFTTEQAFKLTDTMVWSANISNGLGGK